MKLTGVIARVRLLINEIFGLLICVAWLLQILFDSCSYDFIPVTCNFRIGSTIAKNLSAERAVKVKTETPIDISFAHSESLHNSNPKGQESKM